MSREVNMTTTNEAVYVRVSDAIRARDHGLMMIGKWQEKVDAAEAVLAELLNQNSAPVPVPVAEQE
jgi:hypothetical protein